MSHYQFSTVKLHRDNPRLKPTAARVSQPVWKHMLSPDQQGPSLHGVLWIIRASRQQKSENHPGPVCRESTGPRNDPELPD